MLFVLLLAMNILTGIHVWCMLICWGFSVVICVVIDHKCTSIRVRYMLHVHIVWVVSCYLWYCTSILSYLVNVNTCNYLKYLSCYFVASIYPFRKTRLMECAINVFTDQLMKGIQLHYTIGSTDQLEYIRLRNTHGRSTAFTVK